MQFTYPSSNRPRGFHGLYLVGAEEEGCWYPTKGLTNANEFWNSRDRALRAVVRAVEAVAGVFLVDDRMSQGSLGTCERLQLLVHFNLRTRPDRRREAVETAIREALTSLEV
jgi:hypothetical protein